MATNTFERKIEITSPEALKKLEDIMNSDPPKQSLSEHPYGTLERKN